LRVKAPPVVRRRVFYHVLKQAGGTSISDMRHESRDRRALRITVASSACAVRKKPLYCFPMNSRKQAFAVSGLLPLTSTLLLAGLLLRASAQ